MKQLLVLLLTLLLGQAAAAAVPQSPAAPQQRAVLVTGASTGIGRKVAERLAQEGYLVFAGARKEQDLKDLSSIPNVRGIRLDVTSTAEVAAAVEVVRASGHALHGIVNNAGVVIIDPVLSTKDEDFDFQMQVNVYGVFRVTKAFLPLVIAAKGRVVNISSISAFLTGNGSSAYAMSKAAVEAFTGVLANEMAPLGVSVSAVEPGAYNTNIMKPALERSTTKGFNADRSALKPPDEVATVVLQALSDAKPKRRYLIAPEQAQAERTIRAAIATVVQLNEDQAFTIDRDGLVRLLDEALAKTRAR